MTGGEAVLLIILAFALSFFNSFVLMKCWNWLMPAVFSLPALSYVVTLALQNLVSIFTYRPLKPEEGKSFGETVTALFSKLGFYLATLGFAYLLLQLM